VNNRFCVSVGGGGGGGRIRTHIHIRNKKEARRKRHEEGDLFEKNKGCSLVAIAVV